MLLNLKEKCHDSKHREFFYGVKVNKDIVDVYLGLCFLDPGEEGRKGGPGRGHEEISYVISGKLQMTMNNEDTVISEGEVYFIPDGTKVRLKNLSDDKTYFVISGGHVKQLAH